jgi:hypothetical protein
MCGRIRSFQRGFTVIALLGSIAALVGAIWIAVIAFQNGDTVWGVLSIFCGIVAIVYGAQHFEECKVPLILLIVGAVVGGVGRAMVMQT